jgi:hypothetical protein
MASEWQIIKDLYKGFGNNPRNAETFEALANINPLFSAYRGAKTLSNVDVSPMRKSLLNEAYGISDPNVNKQAANQVKDTLFGLLDVAPVAGAATPAIKAGGKTLAKEAARQIETGTGLLGSSTIDPRTYITAYHGSPAKFEAFDSSKIGSSGNGKAYGYGGYFGGTPQIAETYSGETIKYTPTLEKFTNNLNYFIDNSGNYMKVRDYVKNDIPSKVSKDEYMNKFNETMNLFNNQPEKNLYKVDIPDEKLPYMLDWNLPLSKQTKEIQSIVKNNPDLLKEAQYISSKQDPTGMNIYHSKGTGKEASDYFSNLGIYGNKYLDLQSKKDMNPVSNYVVYNPETVKILERNGLLLP